MSEYAKNFNWDESWLNSSPIKRSTKILTDSEPKFQHKRRLKPDDTFSIRSHFSQANSSKDDYFLLGRQDSKFFDTVPYRAGKRRSQSAHNQTQLAQNESPRLTDKETRGMHPAHSHTQTLQSEVRDAIKPNKQAKPRKEKAKQSRSRSHSGKGNLRPVERWPEIKLDLSPESTRKQDEGMPNAPRPANSNNLLDGCEKDTRRQPHNPSLLSGEKRLENKTPVRRLVSDNRKNNSFTSPEAIEYNNQFRVNRAREPQTQNPTNTVCNRRVKSASKAYKKPLVSLGESEKSPRKRFTTEYCAKFKDFTNLPTSNETFQNAYATSIEARKHLLNKNQETHDTHFSRGHLAQLPSASLFCWDPPSSTRSTNIRPPSKKLESYYRQPAGVPSSPSGPYDPRLYTIPSYHKRSLTKTVTPTVPFIKKTSTKTRLSAASDIFTDSRTKIFSKSPPLISTVRPKSSHDSQSSPSQGFLRSLSRNVSPFRRSLGTYRLEETTPQRSYIHEFDANRYSDHYPTSPLCYKPNLYECCQKTCVPNINLAESTLARAQRNRDRFFVCPQSPPPVSADCSDPHRTSIWRRDPHCIYSP